MLDVFFLSYNEPYADENFARLLEIAPHARRVNGVKGFYPAHRRCAQLSLTHNFYVVDADAIIMDDFTFDFTPSKYKKIWDRPESDIMFVWKSVNPINKLIYGHGGVKLIPKLPLLTYNGDTSVDFTTGIGLNIYVNDTVSNITAFNYDPFYTWRAALRECAKLVTNTTTERLEHKLQYDYEKIREIKKEAEDRLNIWCTEGIDNPYGEYAIHGAKYGKEYGEKYLDNDEQLVLINDIEWVKNEFNKFF